VARVSDLATRPAVPADAPTIQRLRTACARALDAGARVEPDDVAADLARPTVDLARDTLLVTGPAGELAGWAWVNLGRRAQVDVHPDHPDRGLGTRLLTWVEARARELGSQRLGQNVDDRNAIAAALLGAHGYRPRAVAWLMAISMTAEPVVPEPPAPLTVRPFRAGDAPAAFRLIEDAFAEWQQRPREYPEWARLGIERDSFAPDLSPLAFDGDRLVGAVLSLDFADEHEGYVHQVAVHRDYRDRGIARALLRYAFRGFYRAGRRDCTLWTHSDTGARSLYERVGMTVRRSSTHYSKALTGEPDTH